MQYSDNDRMYANKTIAAVIPAYNEEGFIGDVIRTLPEYIDHAYVIDDGSTDGTWDEILEHADRVEPDGGRAVPAAGAPTRLESQHGPVVVPIQHQTNQGVGAAIKTGYRRALADGMEVTTVIAGDGQTEPDIVERIVKPVATGRADYSKGNRMLSREGMPPLRQFGNFLLALLTKIASGYWKVNDPQNGSTAISLSALQAIDLDALYDDYGFANDMLVRLNVHGMTVADVPRRAVYKNETSHIDFKFFVVSVSWLLLKDFLWRLRVKYLERDFHPLAFFYIGGAATAAGGVLDMVRTVRSRDSVLASNGLVLFVLGWVLMFLAMVFDLDVNEELQVTGESPPDERV